MYKTYLELAMFQPKNCVSCNHLSTRTIVTDEKGNRCLVLKEDDCLSVTCPPFHVERKPGESKEDIRWIICKFNELNEIQGTSFVVVPYIHEILSKLSQNTIIDIIEMALVQPMYGYHQNRLSHNFADMYLRGNDITDADGEAFWKEVIGCNIEFYKFCIYAFDRQVLIRSQIVEGFKKFFWEKD